MRSRQTRWATTCPTTTSCSNAHYVAGDGRVNENIGLTAIQNIFHSEHNRMVKQIEALIQGELDKGDTSFPHDWVVAGTDLTGANRVIGADEWNGERIFQAAKFAVETEYQHLVLGEFARMIDPAIHVFGNVNIHLDAAITSEFANVVYRFGHSMLDENVNIYEVGADGKPVIDPATGQPKLTEMGLIQAFTNPLAFTGNANATADIVLGSINQVGNEIDEFVTGSLRDNLLGLPLDLAALNITRGRDTGVAPLNLFRAQMFSETHDTQLRPYNDWADFGQFLKHAESLVNFVAAYGTHASILGATTLADKRAAADFLVHAGTVGDLKFNPADPASLDAYNFMHSLGAYHNDKLDPRAIHDAAGHAATWSTGSVTGLDQVDMWIGGLAEKQNLFGSMLGSTFEFIFRTQMESLQDGDRLYYLPRTEGMHFNTELENSSFAEMIRDNTGIKHLPGNIFRTPEYTIESSDYFLKNPDGSFQTDVDGHKIATDPATWLHNPQTGQLLVEVLPDGTVHYLGDNNFFGNTIVLGGTEGNDRLVAGQADDDAVWGDGGDDFIDGAGGNDFLYGGDGNDTMFGGQGDDFIHADKGDDSVSGGDGIDNIFGSDGNDYLDGGRGDDAMNGGQGNDIIKGGEGNDELIGNEGDDWIEGGLGGDLLNGDIGAPTGQTPLYGGNDVLIGGPDGGDRMQGFNGDDIMLGIGSFDKFEGRLGFDWASYEEARFGVDADLTRREFIAANGAVDTIRDFFIAVEGVSGSAHDDILKGSDNSKLLTTKDELSNVNLITGLSGFFDPGPVLFDGGNIMLGGSGSDRMIGGGGNDILDGDAWLHVGLTKDGPGGQIIRQIQYDADGNTWDPLTETGHINAANVDTAVFTDVMANYNIALFGPDAEGFLTIQHNVAGVPVAGVVDDGTDRVRNIERLEFSDFTIAIDKYGNTLNPLIGDAHYDAVPIGTPLITETAAGGAVVDPAVAVTVGSTLTANVQVLANAAGINLPAGQLFDADGINGAVHLQWQVLDVLRAVWVPIAGATSATFKPTSFQVGESIRVQASFMDGKGYVETVNSAATALTTADAAVNTAPFVVPQQQLTGIPNTTAHQGTPVDYYAPFTTIFNDQQTAPAALIYTATLANGSPLASVGLSFSFDPVTGAGHFSGTPPVDLVGPLAIRVTATDTGPGTPLSVTNTFILNVLPNVPPVAKADAYATLEDTTLNVATAQTGVLANDTDADGQVLAASLVSNAAHGTVVLNQDGTFAYAPDANWAGTDSFTYQAFDGIDNSAVTTVTLSVAAVNDGAAPLAIRGALAVGQTLTAVLGADPDGAGTTPSYVWTRDGVQVGTGATYNVAAGDLGFHLAVKATYTDGQGFDEAVASTTGAVGTLTLDALHPAATPAVEVHSTLLDVTGAAIPGTVAYTWQTSADGITFTTPGNAVTGTTFDPGVTSTAGIFVRATANYTDLAGTPEQVSSGAIHYIQDNATARTLNGVAGADIIFGAGGADKINARGGDDTIVGGAGADTMTGGNGADVFAYQALSDSTPNPVGSITRDTITDWESVDRIDLSALDANAVLAGQQNFAFIGLGTVDRNVGAGQVKYYQTNGSTYVIAGVDGDGVADFQVELTGNQTLTADNFLGLIAPNSPFNYVGTNGSDFLRGGAGNDTFQGGLGRDVLTGGGGADSFRYASLNDSKFGANARDVITDWNNGDTIDLTTLDANVVQGGIQHFVFRGLGSADNIVGAGDMKYYHAGGNTILVAGATAGTGTFQIELTGTKDLTLSNFLGVIDANAPRLILGTPGADKLVGGGGNDTIQGGLGRDVLTGGGGADTFVYTSVAESVPNPVDSLTRDVVTDWSSADTLDFRAIDANITAGANGVQHFVFDGLGSADRVIGAGHMKYYNYLGNTYVVAGVDGDKVADFQLEITGVHVLTSSNFLLG